MSEDLNDFMVYILRDSGERIRLKVTEKEFRENRGINVLHSKQVAIIVKNKLKRMFIWKGHESSVRKKFIASRVALALQSDLMTTVHFYRCKIVSVDQGDEPREFLDAFGFDILEIPETWQNEQDIEQLDEHDFDEHLIEETIVIEQPQTKTLDRKQKFTQIQETKKFKPPASRLKAFGDVANEKKSKIILEKIIQTPLPKNSTRKNILIGYNILYGETIKKTKVFGKKIEEKEWTPVSNLSREMYELEGHIVRIYFNNEIGKIEAVEILEENLAPKVKIKKDIKKIKDEKIVKGEKKEEIDYNKWTVKQLKSYCSKNKIKVPSSYRKVDIIKLVKNFNK